MSSCIYSPKLLANEFIKFLHSFLTFFTSLCQQVFKFLCFNFMGSRIKQTKSTMDTSTIWSYYNIVIEHDEQKKLLNNIRNRNILMGRSLYLLILEEIEITSEFMEIVNRIKWKTLFFIWLHAYKNLVY